MARIQIGSAARRRPDGTFLPSRPIYRDAADEEAAAAHDDAARQAAKIFAAKFRAYVEARPEERAR